MHSYITSAGDGKVNHSVVDVISYMCVKLPTTFIVRFLGVVEIKTLHIDRDTVASCSCKATLAVQGLHGNISFKCHVVSTSNNIFYKTHGF